MDIKKAHREIGFIGLGIMGKPMVKNLIKAGYSVFFYARKKSIINEIVKLGGKLIDDISSMPKYCKIIILNLPNTKDVEKVILSKNGLYENVNKGTIIIDMSTISPEITKVISEKLKLKYAYLIDAPVSGGEVGAVSGNLSIMIGGNKKIVNKVKHIFHILGENITYIGDSGSGQVSKACNQILVAGTMVAVSEILLLAKKSKCDFKLIQKALMGGFAYSKVLEIHGKRMISNDYKPGFKAALHLKDLKIANNLAQKLGLRLNGARYSHKLMNEAINNNYSENDSSVINKIILKNKK